MCNLAWLMLLIKIKRVREAGCYDRQMRIMANRKELEISTPLVAYTGHVAGTLFLTDFGYDYNILPTIISTMGRFYDVHSMH